MKETIVILGASGTLGTYLVDELSKMGQYRLVVCGNRNLNEAYYQRLGIETAKIDIRQKTDFEALPTSNVKAVVQIAGVMPSRMEGYEPSLYLETNILGSFNVLEYCRVHNVEKYIFTQSHSDVAGFWNTGKAIPPDASRRLNLKGDHAVYIISKNAAVDLSEHYFQDFGIKNVILRLPTIYSYRSFSEMYVDGRRAIMAYRFLIDEAKKGSPLEIWGDPTISKDIVYVKDFTQMVVKAISSENSRGFYNVATGKATSLEEQVRGVAKVFNPTGRSSEIIYRPEKPSQTSYLYDIENAKKDLGYEPKYNYLQLLEDMKLEMELGRFEHIDEARLNYKSKQ